VVSSSTGVFEIDGLDTTGTLQWGHAWSPAAGTTWTASGAVPITSPLVMQSYATTAGGNFTANAGLMDAFGIDSSGHLRTLWYWQSN
jgi:hypothetical protein